VLAIAEELGLPISGGGARRGLDDWERFDAERSRAGCSSEPPRRRPRPV